MVQISYFPSCRGYNVRLRLAGKECDRQASPSRHRIHGESQSFVCPLPFLKNPTWAINGLRVDRQFQRDLLRPRHP